ncbi:hypothetical protein D1B31_21065 [Neobacillus notoginsengisoli]|uniref:Uncharacterized protein n=1 Tax=Neobacillus notoginsengisoli TaxID=1578198 RepID=A0A417YIG6_9BACI|nr:hypothetical protein [Neobacillus notoginsengisoli]RHW32838.1 hypothetical protein D1B31_21065 [Neobacillus notoginsengisoli]
MPHCECIIPFRKESDELTIYRMPAGMAGAFGILCCEGTRKVFILQEGVNGWQKVERKLEISKLYLDRVHGYSGKLGGYVSLPS